MNPFRLILREVGYRRLNFSLGVLAVTIAVACFVSQMVGLKKHDARTERILAAREAETRDRMALLQEDYRKITKGLGFNVLILPRDQNLSDLFAQDYATNCMPEEYVERLAKSRIVTIQHLLPSLQQKLKWPERERTIILTGVRGEVPILHADPKKPILEAVPAGTIVLGHELHRSLNLKAGDQLKLLGREFKVAKLHPERGTKDDITAWIDLKAAQQLLDKVGFINGILALECVCAADSLAKIRAEIAQILPETQVIEFHSQTLARAEARQRAAVEAQTALVREKENRARLRQERESFAGILVPIVGLGACIWVGFLCLGNVRERRFEIGLLRAVGAQSTVILLVFLGRAAVMGLLGALLGYALGALSGATWGEGISALREGSTWFDPRLLSLVLAGTPVVAALASWLPSFTAAQQDPATILARE